MECLNRFKAKMQTSGGSLRQENINSAKYLLSQVFDDDPSYPTDVYMWSLGDKNYDEKIPISIRMYRRKHTEANGETVKFQTPYDVKINVGDVIYQKSENQYWICTESYNKGDINHEGSFTLCNWILKWQNESGDILEYPCFDRNATQYNSGEQTNKQYTIGSSQHIIWLPCDENTVVLATPKRFYLDRNLKSPTSYIITQNDTTSFNIGGKGIVRITLLECANNSNTDRPDLGICDYIDKDMITNTTDSTESIGVVKSAIEYTSDVIRSGGDIQTFTGKFYDNNGNEINGINTMWRIVCDFTDVLNVSYEGNSILIGIDNDDHIDDEFRLILSDGNNNTSSMIIRIESLL